jgi:hypothetical protein
MKVIAGKAIQIYPATTKTAIMIHNITHYLVRRRHARLLRIWLRIVCDSRVGACRYRGRHRG